jgi:hypothetical protein
MLRCHDLAVSHQHHLEGVRRVDQEDRERQEE